MLDTLRLLSEQLGADPLLVQAAGGNTSIKRDGVMWIKASGTWLKEASAKDIFVPLDLMTLHAALMRDDPACEACTEFVRHDLNALGLRPSIETSVHGLLPQPVVLHVHCVNTIAWAIQDNAKALLAPLLAGMPWAFVPYARPGLQLSRVIRSVLHDDTSILILENHGLVVAADTEREAHELLNTVVARLQKPVRAFPEADVERLAQFSADSAYTLPSDARCHGFAMWDWACVHGASNVYYPDHAVFLGTSIPRNMLSDAPAVVVPNAGVLIHRSAKPSIEPMLGCLSDVFSRLGGDEKLKALTASEIGALLNWDAEKYRQTLSA
jgi:rhamnose utilization protein RhaD (predicted bifunctional aldolase and dehydrogenase)